MEEEIARLMLKMSKFEFYLVNRDIELARTTAIKGLNVVTGIDWNRLARWVEAKHPFTKFDFAQSRFQAFKETAPQYLVKMESGRLGWDSDDRPIDSWERLLSRSFAQLRNNIAHGNKAQMPAPFTRDRTAQFLEAGDALIDFMAREVFDEPGWETPIVFR
jgi:hypothetical protein